MCFFVPVSRVAAKELLRSLRKDRFQVDKCISLVHYTYKCLKHFNILNGIIEKPNKKLEKTVKRTEKVF